MSYYVTPELIQEETIQLNLTDYEAKVIIHYLSQCDPSQINEPHIKSILNKLKS